MVGTGNAFVVAATGADRLDGKFTDVDFDDGLALEVVGDDVKVTVFIDRAMSLGAEISGNLLLYGATTLEGGFTVISIEQITISADQDATQDDIRKKITYPMAGGKKFYKAVIEPAD
mgnify:CR=1 FL=1